MIPAVVFVARKPPPDRSWGMFSDQPRIPITDHIRNQLRLEKGRTNCGGYKLLKIAGEVPDGLYPNTIEQWIKGTGTTARQDHIDFVMHAYRSLPSVSAPASEMTDVKHRLSQTAPKDFEVTRDDLNTLKAELERTGATWRMILNQMSQRPDWLNSTMLSNILHGRRKSFHHETWDRIIAILRSMPNCS